jgi:hypothetical protein
VPAVKVVTPGLDELAEPDAVQRAEKFLGVIGVQPPQARKSLVEEDTTRGTRTWVIVWYTNLVPATSGQGFPFAKIEMDSKTGELMHLSVLDPARSGRVSDKSSAFQEARLVASELSVPAGFSPSHQFAVPIGSETMWVIRWTNPVGNDIQRNDFVEVDFTQAGWLGYQKNIRPLPKDMAVIVPRENAIERANGQLKHVSLGSAPRLLSATTQIVQPNYFFTPGGLFKQSSSSYVAWVCEFAFGHDGRVIVWIDAQTGEILGGDQTL